MKPLGTFRFALALAVLFGHTFAIGWYLFPKALQPIGSIAAQLGVLMFFTVSGYIIFFTVERHYATRPGAFLVNRVLRIYPVHVATFIMACLILIPFKYTEYTGDIPQISRAGFRLSEYLMGLTIFPGWYFSPNPAMWSVHVEAQFYVFVGLASFLPQRRAIYWAAGAIVCSCVLLELNPVPWLVDIRYGAYGPFFAFFALGGAIHYAGARRAWTILALALAATMKYILVLTVRPDIPSVAMAIAFLATLGVFLLLITKGRASRIDGHLGGLSYPLYACHVPIIAFMAHGRRGVIDWLLVAGTCISVAALLYLLIERPLMGARGTVRKSWRLPIPGGRLRQPVAVVQNLNTGPVAVHEPVERERIGRIA